MKNSSDDKNSTFITVQTWPRCRQPHWDSVLVGFIFGTIKTCLFFLFLSQSVLWHWQSNWRRAASWLKSCAAEVLTWTSGPETGSLLCTEPSSAGTALLSPWANTQRFKSIVIKPEAPKPSLHPFRQSFWWAGCLLLLPMRNSFPSVSLASLKWLEPELHTLDYFSINFKSDF